MAANGRPPLIRHHATFLRRLATGTVVPVNMEDYAARYRADSAADPRPDTCAERERIIRMFESRIAEAALADLLSAGRQYAESRCQGDAPLHGQAADRGKAE